MVIFFSLSLLSQFIPSTVEAIRIINAEMLLYSLIATVVGQLSGCSWTSRTIGFSLSRAEFVSVFHLLF